MTFVVSHDLRTSKSMGGEWESQRKALSVVNMNNDSFVWAIETKGMNKM